MKQIQVIQYKPEVYVISKGRKIKFYDKDDDEWYGAKITEVLDTGEVKIKSDDGVIWTEQCKWLSDYRLYSLKLIE